MKGEKVEEGTLGWLFFVVVVDTLRSVILPFGNGETKVILESVRHMSLSLFSNNN